jgi:hypothetical protein
MLFQKIFHPIAQQFMGLVEQLQAVLKNAGAMQPVAD